MATDDRFSTVDYVVFSIMLLISALIGIWYGCGPGGKQKTTAEYLLRERQMKKVASRDISDGVVPFSHNYAGLAGEICTDGTLFYVAIFNYVFGSLQP